jgi:hypothetical protein
MFCISLFFAYWSNIFFLNQWDLPVVEESGNILQTVTRATNRNIINLFGSLAVPF